MKKLVVNITLFLILFLFPIVVFASDISGEIVLEKSDITKGEKLKATIRLDQSSKEEVTVFQTRIDFDENLLSIDEDSFKTYNGWDSIEYNPKTHTLVLLNKYGSNLNEEVISFDIKLGSKVAPTKTRIGLKDAIVANDEKDVYLNDISNDIRVNLSSNMANSNYNKKANLGDELSTGSVKLYYMLTLIVLELVIAIVLVLIYYTASSKFTSRKSKRTLAIVLSAVELVALSAFFTFDVQKGDLNSDKLINQEDVDVLIKHLSNKEMLSTFKLEKADLNGDGKITPSDLAILLSKTYAKNTYVAKLSDSVLEENGYEKGEKIEVKFLADVTDDEEIEYVLMEGKKYKVKKTDKKDEYAVELEASNVSKKYKYNISEVILANGRSAKVDYVASIVVLKDAPVLTGFTAKENVEKAKMNVALTIKDADDAITNATYELVNSSGKIEASGDLVKGKNSLELRLENAVNYKLKINIAYNRSESSGEYSGVIEDAYDLKLITDYRFRISNINLLQNNVVTNNLEKNTPTVLKFVSTNASSYVPKSMNINGRDYTVSNLGRSNYKVNIPNSILDGSKLYISKVTLSNGKVMNVKEYVTYNILKNKPVVIGLQANEDISSNTLNVVLDYNDSDSALKKYVVKLFDKDDKYISEAVYNGTNAILPTNLTSKYIIRVYASYDRMYGNVVNDELTFETTIDAKMKANINSATVSEKYPTKNSVVDLEYNITSNYNSNVKKLIINNIIYDVSKVDINTYKVGVNVGEQAGLKVYNVDKIVFENGLEYEASRELRLDVLKDIPVMENFKIEENIRDSQITVSFDLYDNDVAFNKGVIKLASEGEEPLQKEIIPGKNTLLFDVTKDKKYQISLDIDATLDSKELSTDSPNVLTNYNLYTTEYAMVTGTKVDITSMEVRNSKNEETLTFEKNEPINIKFTTTELTGMYPVKVKVNGVAYDLTKVENAYEFSMKAGDIAGEQEIKFDSLILDNHQEVLVSCIKKIEVLKSLPEVSIEVTPTEETALNISLDDKDSVLLGDTSVIVSTEEAELYNGPLSSDIKFNRGAINKFTIKLVGSYNLSAKEDNETHKFTDKEFYIKTIDLNDILSKDSFKDIKYRLAGSEEFIDEVALANLANLEVLVTNSTDETEVLKVKKVVTQEDKTLIYLDKDVWYLYNDKIYNYIVLDFPVVNNIVQLN